MDKVEELGLRARLGSAVGCYIFRDGGKGVAQEGAAGEGCL